MIKNKNLIRLSLAIGLISVALVTGCGKAAQVVSDSSSSITADDKAAIKQLAKALSDAKPASAPANVGSPVRKALAVDADGWQTYNWSFNDGSVAFGKQRYLDPITNAVSSTYTGVTEQTQTYQRSLYTSNSHVVYQSSYVGTGGFDGVNNYQLVTSDFKLLSASMNVVYNSGVSFKSVPSQSSGQWQKYNYKRTYSSSYANNQYTVTEISFVGSYSSGMDLPFEFTLNNVKYTGEFKSNYDSGLNGITDKATFDKLQSGGAPMTTDLFKNGTKIGTVTIDPIDGKATVKDIDGKPIAVD